MTDEDMEKKNLAVIGDQDFTLGFQLAGVEKVFEKENYREKIQELTSREDIGILVVKEKDLKELPERIQKNVSSSVDPVVVPLSEEAESERLQEKIKKAIGADITPE
ncbi:V-type ATP synthase subunit F [Candidatus Nanohaloarchaea archaeon]|nr:V-type ATP synthase subunit F [Candidatus Nanohaloarchaea archaeon]